MKNGFSFFREMYRSLQNFEIGGERERMPDELIRAFGVLKKAAAPAVHDVHSWRQVDAKIGFLCAVDADHRGAHVGEQHGGEGRRADAGQLDNCDPSKWSHGQSSVRFSGS